MHGEVYLGCGPLPVTVTTRSITFLVGNPEQNLYLPLLLGGGHTQGIPTRPTGMDGQCGHFSNCQASSMDLAVPPSLLALVDELEAKW